MKKYNFIGITILFLVGASYFGYQIWEDMHFYKGYKVDYAKTLDLSETMVDPKEYILPWEGDKTKREANFRLLKAKQSLSKAKTTSIVLVLFSVFYLGLIFTFFKMKRFNLKNIAISTLLVSFLFLTLGVFTPMMEIYAFMDGVSIPIGKGWDSDSFLSSLIEYLPDELQLEGEMYAFYQCKSIADFIGVLFKSGNVFVGIAILCFSVIFPMLKLLFSYLFVVSNNIRNKKLFINIVSYVGKFSMADVFVVAILLAYFAFSSIDQLVKTGGATIIGLYFFTGYCVLSIAVFFVIKKLTGKYFVERKIGYEESLVLDPHQPQTNNNDGE